VSPNRFLEHHKLLAMLISDNHHNLSAILKQAPICRLTYQLHVRIVFNKKLVEIVQKNTNIQLPSVHIKDLIMALSLGVSGHIVPCSAKEG
jgi:hypothetical protein